MIVALFRNLIPLVNNSDVFYSIKALQSGLPDLTAEHIRYVFNALRPEDTEEQADKHFKE